MLLQSSAAGHGHYLNQKRRNLFRIGGATLGQALADSLPAPLGDPHGPKAFKAP